MLIILEGVDCSGKGWLADYLLKKGPQPMVYLKQGSKPKKGRVEERTTLQIAYEAMLKAYISELAPMGCHAIFDRFYPSELAYAETMRGYDPWVNNSFNLLEAQINSMAHALVYVQAPKELILERMEARGEDYIDTWDLDDIMIGYDNFMRKTSIKNVIKYSSLEIDPDDLIAAIFKES